ncbi:hypothetical protein BASA81_002573 [Batrachochytrium salamandrivorans]|nr:hypothetical protein BASA81_002573 [Batrachochytrium salamandrivorans]
MDKLLDQIRAKVEHTLSLLRSQSLARKRLFAVTFAIFFYSIARQYSRYRQRVGGLAPNHQSVDLTLEESATALYNTKLAGLEQQLGLPTLVNGQVKPQVLVAGQAGSGKTSFVSQQPSDKIQFVEVSEGEEEDGGDTSPHLVLLFVDAANVQVSDKMKQLVKKHEDKAFVLLNRADELSGRKQAILQAFGRAVVQLGGNPTRVLLTSFASPENNGDKEWQSEFQANERQVLQHISQLDAVTVLRQRAASLKQTCSILLQEERARGWFQSRPSPGDKDSTALKLARTRFTSAQQLQDLITQVQDDVEPAIALLAKQHPSPLLVAKL